MPEESEVLLGRLIGGDASAATEIRERADQCSTTLLVAAAVVGDGSDELLARASSAATTTRDRQLVSIAAAHLDGNDELLYVLVRDHLVEYPDNVVAAWIATHPVRKSVTESSR